MLYTGWPCEVLAERIHYWPNIPIFWLKMIQKMPALSQQHLPSHSIKPCLRHDLTDMWFCCISKYCILTTYCYDIFRENINGVFIVAKFCWKLWRYK